MASTAFETKVTGNMDGGQPPRPPPRPAAEASGMMVERVYEPRRSRSYLVFSLVAAGAALLSLALLVGMVLPENSTARDRSLAIFEKPKGSFECDMPPFLPVWNFDGITQSNVQLKVLTYNLFWWNLFEQRKQGRNAGNLIARFGKARPFDLMGFQECENGTQILEYAGLRGQYNLSNVFEGGTKAICIAYHRDVFDFLSAGHNDVGEDHQSQYYGKRAAQWVRLLHKQTNTTVFFMNHHGPLPLDTGGKCGGVVTAYQLLDQITKNAQKGDAVILTGDFNAGNHAVTIRELEKHLFRIYTGVVDGGIDNIFSNIGNTSIIGVQNMGNGGSDHDALHAVVKLSAGVSMPVLPERPSCCYNIDERDFNTDASYKVKGNLVLKALSGQYLTIDRDNSHLVQPPTQDGGYPGSAMKRRLTVLPALDVFGFRGSFVAEEAGFRMRSPEAATPFKQILNNDGSVSFRTESGEFLTIEHNGTATTRRSGYIDPQLTRFHVFTTAWVMPFSFIQAPEQCCSMCHIGMECQAWTWRDQNCLLRGGGVLEKVHSPGVLGGVRSKQEVRSKPDRPVQTQESPRTLLQGLDGRPHGPVAAAPVWLAPQRFMADSARETVACCAVKPLKTCSTDTKISGYCNLSPARCESVCLGTWLQPEHSQVVDNVFKQMMSNEASVSVWTPPVIVGHTDPTTRLTTRLPTTLPMGFGPKEVETTTRPAYLIDQDSPHEPSGAIAIAETDVFPEHVADHEEPTTTTLPPTEAPTQRSTEAPPRPNEAPVLPVATVEQMSTTTPTNEMLEGDEQSASEAAGSVSDDDDTSGCCSYEPFIGCGDSLHISNYCDTKQKCQDECIGHWLPQGSDQKDSGMDVKEEGRDPNKPCCSFAPFRGCGDELSISKYCDDSQEECESKCIGTWLPGGAGEKAKGIVL